MKMFCFADEETIRELEERTKTLGMPYTAIDRGSGAWEIVPVGYSKGTGIDFLRKRLGMSREECFAFGDSTNDLTMFEHAGCSVAMGNAPEEVKRACGEVTADCDEDGAAIAIERRLPGTEHGGRGVNLQRG